MKNNNIYFVIFFLLFYSCSTSNESNNTRESYATLSIPDFFQNPYNIIFSGDVDDPEVFYSCDTFFQHESSAKIREIVCEDTVLRRQIIYDYNKSGKLFRITSLLGDLFDGAYYHLFNDTLKMEYYIKGGIRYKRYLHKSSFIEIYPEVLTPVNVGVDKVNIYPVGVPYKQKGDFKSLFIEYEISYLEGMDKKIALALGKGTDKKGNILIQWEGGGYIEYTPVLPGLYRFRGKSSLLEEGEKNVKLNDEYINFVFYVPIDKETLNILDDLDGVKIHSTVFDSLKLFDQRHIPYNGKTLDDVKK